MAAEPTSAVVELVGLEVRAFHGALPAERELGQRFLIDVRLEMADCPACRTDRLADAVDYAHVADRVVELATERPYALLERLAEVIAADMRATDGVTAVRVTVHKPSAPIAHPFADVAVTVER
jgi:dihydroneopterin aldolase